MSDDASKPWYAPGLTFECTRCGNCCTGPSGYVWFSDEEGRQIAEYLGLEEKEFKRRYARRKFGKWTLDEIKRGRGRYDCVFLQRDGQGKALCGIYPVRPTQCRTWPFWPENLRSRDAWEEAARGCPGMRQEGAGNFVPVEQVRIIADSNPETL